MPINLKSKVEHTLKTMTDKGVISPIDYSEWASPIVPVVKKNGDIRICGDFKVSVNQKLLINQYPLPKIENIFANLNGGKLFSKIDFSEAYLQIELDEISKKICTINTSKGLFIFNRLPYGIASSPSIFQKIMYTLFCKLEGVSVFMDDILVAGKNGREHLVRLRNVFNKIKECGLKVNLSKCQFFQKSICYLGHIIDAEGLYIRTFIRKN